MSHFHHHHHGQGRDRWAVIRNPRSGLVVDASDKVVKLQHFTGFPAQLWKLEPASAGKFFIINQANGRVLDIQGGPGKGNTLITWGKHGGSNQQWYVNSDDTIVSDAGNLALDINENKFLAGNYLIVWERHGADNQKFQLQYQ